ncbi:MAG: ferrous iron transport protein A [Chlorobiaceae bacterium]|nr:ferrous iron transport protein A [Chlorobiaceae bacterium]NTV26749.1 ferrous iron transport protein A [Chlorobiaceae bacterium]
MSPLGVLGKGEVGQIVNLRHGRQSAVGGCERAHAHSHHAHGRNSGKRLADMGFSPGQTIEVIENNPAMPMLVRIHDSRVAIDRSIAMRIMVRRIVQ